MSFMSYAMIIFCALIIKIDISCPDTQTTKFCREKERLISADEFDEYLLAEAEINDTIVLECRFCNAAESNPQPKLWYWQDRYKTEPEREVKLEMDNNVTLNRIRMLSELSLVIRDVSNTDAGIYRCHGEEGQEAENKYNYKVERKKIRDIYFIRTNNDSVFRDETVTTVERGNITEWEKYREINLLPVTTRFAVSKMEEIAKVRKSGVILEVVTEWSPWNACENCLNNRGVRTCNALCRIKRRINETYTDNSTVLQFFKKSPTLPCRSSVLAEILPSISRVTRYLPSFVLFEKCRFCKRIRKVKKFRFKYKRRHVLREGSHLVTICPESNVESDVIWRKDGLILKKGTGQSLSKKDKRSRIIVDAFSTVYLIDVSNDEEGNYTCYVNGVNMMTLKVVVVSKSRLMTQAFFRHLWYLGFILLLTSFCYCAGLLETYRRKDTFDITSFEEIKVENTESTELLEVEE